MKYRFDITYVDNGPRSDPEQDESATALKKTIEQEFDDSIHPDEAKRQVTFDFEEQKWRILTIEGSPVE